MKKITEKEAAHAIAKYSFIILIIAAIVSVAPAFLDPYYPASRYQDLLRRLEGRNYTIVHDCDFRIDGIKTLLEIENKQGIRTIYFLRPDADYFTSHIPYFKNLESQGVIFGFHYDALSRSNNDTTAALQLFRSQLAFMRSFLNISFSRSHGDAYNLKINNQALYNKTAWAEMGLTDLSNETLAYPGYIADTNHNWFEKWADPILVNLHSDFW